VEEKFEVVLFGMQEEEEENCLFEEGYYTMIPATEFQVCFMSSTSDDAKRLDAAGSCRRQCLN